MPFSMDGFCKSKVSALKLKFCNLHGYHAKKSEILIKYKSTGQIVVNDTASNLIYSFISKVAGCDLYVLIKMIKRWGFPINYKYKGSASPRCHLLWTNAYYNEKS